mgnify:CR=1 FL=1|jgi:predicted nucleic acid-binding Zn ribbon protein|tara:strand:+ start:15007 stop:15378 length:372 start_codon:yes stop_codon:yes gene_type:complete
MPLYIFQNPDTGEEIEVLQSMKENHVYVDDKGLKWSRVFLAANASIDTQGDCFSKEDFARRTAKHGMTVGQMWELSKDMSNKRTKMAGKDPLKEKYFKDYKSKRKGIKHDGDPTKKGIGPIQF